MIRTAVDTSVLLDIFAADRDYGEASFQALQQCIQEGVVVACEKVPPKRWPARSYGSGFHHWRPRQPSSRPSPNPRSRILSALFPKSNHIRALKKPSALLSIGIEKRGQGILLVSLKKFRFHKNSLTPNLGDTYGCCPLNLHQTAYFTRIIPARNPPHSPRCPDSPHSVKNSQIDKFIILRRNPLVGRNTMCLNSISCNPKNLSYLAHGLLLYN